MTMEGLALESPLAYRRCVRAPSTSSDTNHHARVKAFVREHEGALEAIALRLCRNRADAHDLVQDTFERALTAFARVSSHSNPRSWLVTILNNLFIDRCRQLGRERRADTPVEQLNDSLQQPVAEADPAWASVTVEHLERALGGVREEFRVAYRMHALEGHSYKEIARVLGIPAATVGTRIARARRQLRELLVPKLAEARQ
jgi:RNA polymerase sigma-70 factor (ECF subfamily)